jgi:hypothetical protein
MQQTGTARGGRGIYLSVIVGTRIRKGGILTTSLVNAEINNLACGTEDESAKSFLGVLIVRIRKYVRCSTKELMSL